MAVVNNENEIYLNGTRYPLAVPSRILRSLSSKFPQKLTIGETNYADQPVLSTWTISDQRAGIGVEEMEYPAQANRCWFSNCDLSWRGHILPRPLAVAASLAVIPTLTDQGLEVWTSATDLTAWTEGGNAPATVDRTTSPHGGTYCAKINTNATGGHTRNINQDAVTWTNDWRNIPITIECWAKSGTGATLQLDDGDGAATTTAINAGASWTHYQLTKITGAAASKLNVKASVLSDGNALSVIVDDIGFPALDANDEWHWCNFNGNTYFSKGQYLFKIVVASGLIQLKGIFPYDITDLVSTIGTQMVICQGHGTGQNFWYMSAAEVFTETNVADARYGIDWDDKFFWIGTDGQISYTATLAASPAVTDKGKINDGSTVQGLQLSRDASGENIIYCGTDTHYWAHDFTNAKFLATELNFAKHPNACKGMIRWNSADYISMGLHVKSYITGGTALIGSVGLDRDDGTPSEYAGEIVKFISDNDCFYALIDSTQSSLTATSWVARYDGFGWQCLWTGASTEGAMHGGIVSDVYSRRLWFDHAGILYYIPLQRTALMPKRDATYTYAASGFLVSPWFNAGTEAYAKLAKVVDAVAKDLTADETVVIKYRIDHATTALAATWTTLATLTASGLTSTDLASSAGVSYKSIQFRFDLVRGATTTNAPDLQAATIGYQKRLPSKWQFDVMLNLSGEYQGKSARELEADIITAIESTTFSEFTYRDSTGTDQTYYVFCDNPSGQEKTGNNYDGKWHLTLVEA